MNRKYLTQIFEAAAITLILSSVLQELERPEEEREWHGKVASFIPYDFRLPTIERFRESYWNPYERRVLTPEVFGIGWAINFHALLENMGIIKRGVSEENFLIPTESIKQVLSHAEPEY